MPRILVIDDSRSSLEMVAMMLVRAGNQVRCCADGNQVQQMIEREAFDLILTDIFMPERDGLEIIMNVRRLRPNLPIIAMSGKTGALDMLAVARHLGACQLLRKPFSNTELLEAVEMTIAKPLARGTGLQR